MRKTTIEVPYSIGDKVYCIYNNRDSEYCEYCKSYHDVYTYGVFGGRVCTVSVKINVARQKSISYGIQFFPYGFIANVPETDVFPTREAAEQEFERRKKSDEDEENN